MSAGCKLKHNERHACSSHKTVSPLSYGGTGITLPSTWLQTLLWLITVQKKTT